MDLVITNNQQAADKVEIKKCLDELGLLLQQIATMEEKEYEVLLEGVTPKMQSYAETVQDLADVANVQCLDQLYRLLEIEP